MPQRLVILLRRFADEEVDGVGDLVADEGGAAVDVLLEQGLEVSAHQTCDTSLQEFFGEP